MKVLIANRAEIAVRITYTIQDFGWESIAIYPEDDVSSLHVRTADQAIQLTGTGTAAYLDSEQIVMLAKQADVDAIHPGYGFLSEDSGFAQRVIGAGIEFIGPLPETLKLFGDKVAARKFVENLGIPVIPGLSKPVTLEEAHSFFNSLPDGSNLVLKAINGGGGRGIRVIHAIDELPSAYERASSEAKSAFGNGDLYVEAQLPHVRHIEVQILGDGEGDVRVLGTRDCSLQRRHQKIVEIAPALHLSPEIEIGLIDAARKISQTANYRSLGTFEFLVTDADFYFLEVNARMQVEHTITEEIYRVDLVRKQFEVLSGKGLTDINEQPNGVAIQCRVNMESMQSDGSTRPSGGTITRFEPPNGVNVRVDSYGYGGYSTNPNFDSLLAKVITKGVSWNSALRRTRQALGNFEIEGVETNTDFLQTLLTRVEVEKWKFHTRYIDDHVEGLVAEVSLSNRVTAASAADLAGAQIKSTDPLAVLAHGKSGKSINQSVAPAARVDSTPTPHRTSAIKAPMQGTVIEVLVEPDEGVSSNKIVAIMEAMKMEHEIKSELAGTVHSLNVAVGDSVYADHALMFIREEESQLTQTNQEDAVPVEHVRDDLSEVLWRHEITLDENRPDAIEKRRRFDQRTARENIEDLTDKGSFVEHGQLALTPGTGLPFDEVIRKFPTDGMITGVGSINGEWFSKEKARSVVMSYDYTVLAGTQGAINHPKTDRMLELAEKWRIPVVLFAEGGGGRAGTGGKRRGGKTTTNVGQGRDDAVYRPLDTPTFASMGRLSGLVPLIGITSRYCFAGNASLLGCCDVIIATENSNIGMGGPALVEGGNLGVFLPEEIGPLEIQRKNGVVDVVVKDETEAVAIAKQYLSYFQGTKDSWDCEDQRKLRHIIPENRLRVYNVRDVIHTLADTGSVLELRRDFGLGMVTSFIRIEGRPVGVVANNPVHLSGAIDSDGSDKAARFLQLCDGFNIPVLVLCDTPGMMVGPEIEKTALVRHCSRLFVTGANLTVPHVTMVLRKAYGLGAQAMAGGSFKEPFAVVAWPTGEFGGMGLEGQVKLGFRNELEMIEDPEERIQRYDALVDAAYQRGRALVAGASFAVDDVIDPADSRRWITASFDSAPMPTTSEGKKRRNIDTW